MKTASTSLLSVTVLLVHLACSEEPRGSAGGTWVAEHDTIGDTVIVRTISGSVGFAEYTLQRELSIGVLDGPEEYVIGNVSMLAVGPEGDIYAYDAQVPVLRKYDRDGRFITTIGREGGGPGEYGRVRGLLVVPDGTVKLWDARGPRLISFSPEGEYLGGRRVESYGFFGSRSLFADTLGNYYVRMRFVEATEDGERTVGRGLLKLGPNGEVVDTLLEPDLRYEPPHLERRLMRGSTTFLFRARSPSCPSRVGRSVRMATLSRARETATQSVYSARMGLCFASSGKLILCPSMLPKRRRGASRSPAACVGAIPVGVGMDPISPTPNRRSVNSKWAWMVGSGFGCIRKRRNRRLRHQATAPRTRGRSGRSPRCSMSSSRMGVMSAPSGSQGKQPFMS